MLTDGIEVAPVDTLPGGHILPEQAVNHHIRMTADRAGEVGVKLKSESKVTNILCLVDSLRHRADRQDLDHILLRLPLDLLEELIEIV